jgi:hypothetical protein
MSTEKSLLEAQSQPSCLGAVMPRCSTCKFWNNSDSETSWNKQHKDYMDLPYKEYGSCNSDGFSKHTFFGTNYFGDYTHKDFGCVFHNEA